MENRFNRSPPPDRPPCATGVAAGLAIYSGRIPVQSAIKSVFFQAHPRVDLGTEAQRLACQSIKERLHISSVDPVGQDQFSSYRKVKDENL